MAQISPEEYRTFIQGLTLRDVRLVQGSMTSHRAQIDPSRHVLHVKDRASFTSLDEEQGFEIRHAYTLSLEDQDTEATCCGQIEAEFALRFDSEIPLTDDIFEIFRQVNLSMNTWPYWREFVQSGAARMNWPAITLPLLKKRLSQPNRPGAAETTEAEPPKAKSKAKAGAATGKAPARAQKKSDTTE